MMLGEVKPEFRYVKKLVLVAVEENGLALQFACAELQADRDVVRSFTTV